MNSNQGKMEDNLELPRLEMKSQSTICPELE